MTARWADTRFPGLQVSDMGRLRMELPDGSYKERPMSSIKDWYVSATAVGSDGIRHTALVHRLVAEAFCPGRSTERNIVHHVDENKSNNCATNLRWVSHKENVQASARSRTRKKAHQQKRGALLEVTDLPGEKWVDISIPTGVDTYAGRYEISSMGRLAYYHNGTKMLKATATNRFGYSMATFKRPVAAFTVHKLVAAAFIGPRPPGMHIDHFDMDKANNRADNLRYVTPQENTRRSVQIRGPRTTRVKEDVVLSILKDLENGVPNTDVAMRYGVSRATVCDIKYGRRYNNVERVTTFEPQRSRKTRSKLTTEQVRLIKEDILCGLAYVHIARLHKIGVASVSLISTGATYRHIPPVFDAAQVEKNRNLAHLRYSRISTVTI